MPKCMVRTTEVVSSGVGGEACVVVEKGVGGVGVVFGVSFVTFTTNSRRGLVVGWYARSWTLNSLSTAYHLLDASPPVPLHIAYTGEVAHSRWYRLTGRPKQNSLCPFETVSGDCSKMKLLRENIRCCMKNISIVNFGMVMHWRIWPLAVSNYCVAKTMNSYPFIIKLLANNPFHFVWRQAEHHVCPVGSFEYFHSILPSWPIGVANGRATCTTMPVHTHWCQTSGAVDVERPALATRELV